MLDAKRYSPVTGKRFSRVLRYAKARLYSLRRVPFSHGYASAKEDFLLSALGDVMLMDCFRRGLPLPVRYGTGFDERVVEYPWLLAHLGGGNGALLDAGGVLNNEILLSREVVSKKDLVVYTLSPESEPLFRRRKLSYIFGDLRATILQDRIFPEVVCISTIEHVGMDGTQFYTADPTYNEDRADDYWKVVVELRRVLIPGGKLYLTIPYGRRAVLGWLQQFDERMLQQLVEAPGFTLKELTFYRYFDEGWQIATATECRDCEYRDVHKEGAAWRGSQAAAGAVACLILVKRDDAP